MGSRAEPVGPMGCTGSGNPHRTDDSRPSVTKTSFAAVCMLGLVVRLRKRGRAAGPALCARAMLRRNSGARGHC